MIQVKDGWVAVMEVASSSSAWVYFEVCQRGVEGTRKEERSRGNTIRGVNTWRNGIATN